MSHTIPGVNKRSAAELTLMFSHSPGSSKKLENKRRWHCPWRWIRNYSFPVTSCEKKKINLLETHKRSRKAVRTLVRIQQIGSTFYSKTPVQCQFWLIFYNTTTKGFHPTLTKVMCIWHGHRKRLGPGHQLTNETEPVDRITQQNTYSRKWGCSMLCHWQHLTQAPELWMCSLQVNCRHTIHLRVVFLSFFQLQTRHRPLRGPMGEDANSMLWWRAVRTKQYAELPTANSRSASPARTQQYLVNPRQTWPTVNSQ